MTATKTTRRASHSEPKTPPWEKKNPSRKHAKLTAAQKASAKSAAEKAGRRYPNLIDNMRAAQRAKSG